MHVDGAVEGIELLILHRLHDRVARHDTSRMLRKCCEKVKLIARQRTRITVEPHFAGGKVDHIPATIFSAFPKLTRLHDAVRDHAGVKSWYAKT